MDLNESLAVVKEEEGKSWVIEFEWRRMITAVHADYETPLI